MTEKWNLKQRRVVQCKYLYFENTIERVNILFCFSTDSEDEEMRRLTERKKHLMNEKERLRIAKHKRQELLEKKKAMLKAEVQELESEVTKMNTV